VKFLTYSNYKDSGISWIGVIPSHWEVKRGKYLFQLARRLPEENDGIVTAFRDGTVTLRSNRRTDGFTNAIKEIGYQGVKKGDLVIHAMDAFAGAVGVSDSDGKCSPVYSCCIPVNGIASEYYARLVRTMSTTGFIESLAKGIRERSTDFRWGDFCVQLLPLPPKDEQQAITNFLDRETARIDKLIAEKQTFIKLLKEKRQALISHVVTKGLNPNVKMKDSGIEWIGEVPEHWGHRKIKHIARISNGATPNRDAEEFWEGGTIGWLNSSKVNDVYIEHADQFITEYALQKTSVQPVKPNDLVMAITGEGQTRGRVAICKTDATINQHLVAISISSKDVHVEYLFYWLTSQYSRIRYESSGAGSTKGAITCTDVGLYPLPMPPFEEQKFIVEAVKQKLCKYDSLMDETDQSIKLLQERRTALISAAVTGKIDVRHKNRCPPNRSC